MSLLKWKEMASSRSKIGREVKNVNAVLKRNKIMEGMNEVEAEKLFKPITTPLQPVLKERKKPPNVPYVPDYGLIDENGVEPQGAKQIPPEPPAYDESGFPTPKTAIKGILSSTEGSSEEPESGDSLEAESGDEEFREMVESLPPPYKVEADVPDYEILEEDQVNDLLDHYGLVNYEKLQEATTSEAKQVLLSKNIDKTTEIRRKFPGYKTRITKQLRKGEIIEAEAQIRRKTIDDTRNIFNDYIKYNKNQLKIITTSGSGLKRGGSYAYPMLFNDPKQLLKKLETIVGSIAAGNNSIALRNTGVAILDMLLRNSIISKSHYKKIYKNFF